MYSRWLKSYRQLPFLYNQWANVIRWEKETRPFLRHREFLWQEGHTLHETKEEALKETQDILNIYIDLAQDILALPILSGKKSQREKFAGAVDTYTIEAMMKDGKALQSGTSHYLGQHFTKAFDIKYQSRDGSTEHPYHTSWGVSTRLIGALIMAHGDNRGLILPPMIAPIQVAIVPINTKKEGVLEKAKEIKDILSAQSIRVELDQYNSNSSGWYFNEYEMKGIPLRIDIGPRDLEQNLVSIFRRDTLEKRQVSLDNLVDYVKNELLNMQKDMLEEGKKRMASKIFDVENIQQILEAVNDKQGFARFLWCGEEECEEQLKQEHAITIRCIDEEVQNGVCALSGKKAKYRVFAGKAY